MIGGTFLRKPLNFLSALSFLLLVSACKVGLGGDEAPAVAAENNIPAAANLSVDVVYETTMNFTVVASDEDEDTLTYEILTQPAHGTLSGTAPNFSYTPNALFEGSDAFTYRVNDSKENSEIATVSLTVSYCAGSYLTNSPFAGGAGTPTNPYTICTAEQMQTIGSSTSYWDKHFKLKADINLAQYTGTQFNIIGNSATKFTGFIDGNNKTISNFTYSDATKDQVGLIGWALRDDDQDNDPDGLVVTNLNLINADVTGRDYVGTVIGRAEGDLVGLTSSGTVHGRSKVGGIVGWAARAPTWLGVENSHSSANVFGADNVGGAIGRLGAAWAKNVYATGTVTGTSDSVGGLIGVIAGGALEYGYATGNVSGVNNVGGVAGGCDNYVHYSYATGNVSGNNFVGGVCGYASLDIHHSYATGNISGVSRVGGIAGRLMDYCAQCYATGNVTATTDYAGGLVGRFLGTSITLSYATGNVSAPTYAGGLVGYADAGANISKVYATGNVSGTQGVGGLVGIHYNGFVSQSYATGLVTGSTEVGGLSGGSDISTTVSYLGVCFWNYTANLSLGVDGGNGTDVDSVNLVRESSDNLKLQSTFTSASWDFAATWKMPSAGVNSGYPIFQWQ